MNTDKDMADHATNRYPERKGDRSMPTRNVFLTEHLDHFVAAGVESGQYSNASEVVREGLRLLEQRQAEERAKVEWLRAAVQQGIDEIERGEGIVYETMEDLERDIDRMRDEVFAAAAVEPAR